MLITSQYVSIPVPGGSVRFAKGTREYASAIQYARPESDPSVAPAVPEFNDPSPLAGRSPHREPLADVPGQDEKELAEHYVALWNAAQTSGDDVDPKELERVDSELAESPWCIQKEDNGHWRVRPSAEVHGGNSSMHYAAARSPKGGVTIGGRYYRGGLWIPGGVVSQATPAAKQAIDSAKQEHVGKRVARGNISHEQLASRLEPHSLKHPLSDSERAGVGASFRGLHHHHGELLLHRLEELTDAAEKAYKRAPEGTWSRQQLGKTLSNYHDMLHMAKAKGVTGKVAKPTPMASAAHVTQPGLFDDDTPLASQLRASVAQTVAQKVESGEMSPDEGRKHLDAASKPPETKPAQTPAVTPPAETKPPAPEAKPPSAETTGPAEDYKSGKMNFNAAWEAASKLPPEEGNKAKEAINEHYRARKAAKLAASDAETESPEAKLQKIIERHKAGGMSAEDARQAVDEWEKRQKASTGRGFQPGINAQANIRTRYPNRHGFQADTRGAGQAAVDKVGKAAEAARGELGGPTVTPGTVETPKPPTVQGGTVEPQKTQEKPPAEGQKSPKSADLRTKLEAKHKGAIPAQMKDALESVESGERILADPKADEDSKEHAQNAIDAASGVLEQHLTDKPAPQPAPAKPKPEERADAAARKSEDEAKAKRKAQADKLMAMRGKKPAESKETTEKAALPKKGDTVQWAAPENDNEKTQRMELLDDPTGLGPGDSIRVRQLNAGLALPVVNTVRLRDILPHKDAEPPPKPAEPLQVASDVTEGKMTPDEGRTALDQLPEHLKAYADWLSKSPEDAARALKVLKDFPGTTLQRIAKGLGLTTNPADKTAAIRDIERWVRKRYKQPKQYERVEDILQAVERGEITPDAGRSQLDAIPFDKRGYKAAAGQGSLFDVPEPKTFKPLAPLKPEHVVHVPKPAHVSQGGLFEEQHPRGHTTPDKSGHVNKGEFTSKEGSKHPALDVAKDVTEGKKTPEEGRKELDLWSQPVEEKTAEKVSEKTSNPHLALTDAIAEKLKSGDVDFGSGVGGSLVDMANKAHGGTRAEGKWGPSDVYDSLEAGFNKTLLGATNPEEDLPEAIEQLRTVGKRYCTTSTRHSRLQVATRIASPRERRYRSSGEHSNGSSIRSWCRCRRRPPLTRWRKTLPRGVPLSCSWLTRWRPRPSVLLPSRVRNSRIWRTSTFRRKKS
jgi:polyhydroxyalkanoate synthesis regulator phasin